MRFLLLMLLAGSAFANPDDKAILREQTVSPGNVNYNIVAGGVMTAVKGSWNPLINSEVVGIRMRGHAVVWNTQGVAPPVSLPFDILTTGGNVQFGWTDVTTGTGTAYLSQPPGISNGTTWGFTDNYAVFKFGNWLSMEEERYVCSVLNPAYSYYEAENGSKSWVSPHFTDHIACSMIGPNYNGGQQGSGGGGGGDPVWPDGQSSY